VKHPLLSLPLPTDAEFSIPFGEEIKFQYAWLVFGLINIVLFIPFMSLKWWGPKLREKSWQAPPEFNKGL
jgi:hypothetical protein